MAPRETAKWCFHVAFHTECCTYFFLSIVPTDIHVYFKVNNNNNNNNNNNKHWYEHVSKSVETSQGGKVTILWNQQVQTDRTVPNSKPDIIIRDNEKGTCMLIDVAM